MEETFAQMLVRLRKERQWTQQDVKDETGLSLVSLCKYETGKAIPKYETLYKLSSALGFDYNEACNIIWYEKKERKNAHERD